MEISLSCNASDTKKARAFQGPGFFRFKTPVSALILRSDASKKQQKKESRGNSPGETLRSGRNAAPPQGSAIM